MEIDWAADSQPPLHQLAIKPEVDLELGQYSRDIMAELLMKTDYVNRSAYLITRAFEDLGIFYSPQSRAKKLNLWHEVKQDTQTEAGIDDTRADDLEAKFRQLQHVSQYSDYLTRCLFRALDTYVAEYHERTDAPLSELYDATDEYLAHPLLTYLDQLRAAFEKQHSGQAFIMTGERVARILILQEVEIAKLIGFLVHQSEEIAANPEG